MKALRHGALLAALLGLALPLRAAERAGPQPAELIYPRSAGAAASGDATEAAAPLSPVPAPSLPGMAPTLGYLVVLVLLAGGAWVLLKRARLPRPFSRSEGKLRVLETRMLGNRQFLVVVEYDEAKLLLGVCPGRIDYLTPLAGHPLAAGAGEEEAPPPAQLAGALAERR